MAEGAFAIRGPKNLLSVNVPCPSFESTPLLPAAPITAMDKRGTAATGCAGWTFVSGDRFAGYQRNNSYFSATAASQTTNGLQTAMIGKAGSMSCSVTIADPGAYVLRFQSNSRNYGGTWFINEVLYIKIDGVQVERVVISNQTWVDRAVELGYLTSGSHTVAFVGSAELATDPCALVDIVRVESTTDSGAVDAVIGRDLTLSVADGATVELDYFGTLTVSRLTIDGRVYTSGAFDAATFPDRFTGSGTLLVKPTATTITIR